MWRPKFLEDGRAKTQMPYEFDQKQLMMGIHEEQEHTKDIYTAMLIAMDHLAEDSHYYSKLRKAFPPEGEKGKKKKKKPKK